MRSIVVGRRRRPSPRPRRRRSRRATRRAQRRVGVSPPAPFSIATRASASARMPSLPGFAAIHSSAFEVVDREPRAHVDERAPPSALRFAMSRAAASWRACSAGESPVSRKSEPKSITRSAFERSKIGTLATPNTRLRRVRAAPRARTARRPTRPPAPVACRTTVEQAARASGPTSPPSTQVWCRRAAIAAATLRERLVPASIGASWPSAPRFSGPAIAVRVVGAADRGLAASRRARPG